MFKRIQPMIFSAASLTLEHSQTTSAARPRRRPDVVWYCREYWTGDSRDGQFVNGDGYHYFEMRGDGVILKALEYYETEDGEERTTEVPELIGLNWFEFFGFEDEELLEEVPEHEFNYVEQFMRKS